MSSEFLYSITPVEKHDNGNKYLINVEVPLDRYWYDDMYIVIEVMIRYLLNLIIKKIRMERFILKEKYF